MKSPLTFISGNLKKVEQTQNLLSHPLEHVALNLTEIQDPDPETVTRHKVQEAFRIINKPVLVDDNAFVIHAWGRLPGTFIKFFEDELGYEKICRLTDTFGDRSATAIVTVGYSDGIETETFRGEIKGSIAHHPKGTGGFGWDTLFIPQGYVLTRAEMDENDYDKTSARKIALGKLSEYLTSKEN